MISLQSQGMQQVIMGNLRRAIKNENMEEEIYGVVTRTTRKGMYQTVVNGQRVGSAKMEAIHVDSMIVENGVTNSSCSQLLLCD